MTAELRELVNPHGRDGEQVFDKDASAELTDCLIHRYKGCGVDVYQGKVMLRAGTSTDNEVGARAVVGAKVTVEAAENTLQNACKDNSKCDWDSAFHSRRAGDISGIPEEKINVRNDE